MKIFKVTGSVFRGTEEGENEFVDEDEIKVGSDGDAVTAGEAAALFLAESAASSFPDVDQKLFYADIKSVEFLMETDVDG